jgi:hypothetical protein
MSSRKKVEVAAKPHINKHLVTEIWFNQEPITEAEGWVRVPVKGRRIVAIRNCLMSDMSC